MLDDIRGLYKIYAEATKDDMDYHPFLELLEKYNDRYGEWVFLIDNLPGVVQESTSRFWCDLNSLEERVQFIFTTTAEEKFQSLLLMYQH